MTSSPARQIPTEIYPRIARLATLLGCAIGLIALLIGLPFSVALILALASSFAPLPLLRRRYALHQRELTIAPGAVFARAQRSRRIILPFGTINRATVRAVMLGRLLAGTSGQLIAIHVLTDEELEPQLRAQFATRFPGVRLVTIVSPYRALIEPLLHLLNEIEEEPFPGESGPMSVVIIPEYVGRHWWDRILHNGNGARLRAELIGRPSTVVIDLPYRRDAV